eukprot:scaffold81868_cov13-Tisochrysis_lutea.AAC.1
MQKLTDASKAVVSQIQVLPSSREASYLLYNPTEANVSILASSSDDHVESKAKMSRAALPRTGKISGIS